MKRFQIEFPDSAEDEKLIIQLVLRLGGRIVSVDEVPFKDTSHFVIWQEMAAQGRALPIEDESSD
ncbi:MAG: hypothetical protein LH606_22305 [Cytophagaceae bacterium]|nr:hypothetical protein [Cytophagaceae bacterium]